MTQKSVHIKISILFLLPLFFFTIFALPAAARDDHRPLTSITPVVTRHEEQNKPTGIMRACESRQSAIKNRLTHLTGLAKNIEDKFTLIAQRVEAFYTSKVVPSGKTVANYDSLVADIQSKKDSVTTALTKAEADVTAFSCTSGDPKTVFTTFVADMQSVKGALKEFRTSIKNLIVAVHSVVGEENKEGTPKPTKTEETPEPTK